MSNQTGYDAVGWKVGNKGLLVQMPQTVCRVVDRFRAVIPLCWLGAL